MGDPEFVRMTKRHGRRVAVTIVGGAVVLAGLVLCVIPGPGLLTLAAGLAILATEYAWAKRLLHKVKAKSRQAIDKARNLRSGAGRGPAQGRNGSDPGDGGDPAAWVEPTEPLAAPRRDRRGPAVRRTDPRS